MTSNDLTGEPRTFQHDPLAIAKIIGLQILALDLLKAGLGARELSDRERVAFGLEFAIVGFKVLTVRKFGKGKGVEMVDMTRLETDVQQVLGESVGTLIILADFRYFSPVNSPTSGPCVKTSKSSKLDSRSSK
jgi:hypothetical protein